MIDPLRAPETEKRQALLWALAEFRVDIGRLFDEQIGLASQRASEGAALAFAALSPSGEDEARASAPPTAAFAPSTAAHEPMARRAAPTGQPARPRESPITTRVAVAGTDQGDRPHDPRERLDALAKLLDRRLKHASGGPSDLVPKPAAD